MKSKRSRLLIMAIADKLNEKEMEIIKVNTTLAKKRFLESFIEIVLNFFLETSFG